MLFSIASLVFFLFLLLLFFQLFVGDPKQNWPSNCFGWFKLADRIFSSWGIEWVSMRRVKPGERGVQCEAQNDVLHCEKSEVFLLETCTHTPGTRILSIRTGREGEGVQPCPLVKMLVCLSLCWASDKYWVVCVCLNLCVYCWYTCHEKSW